VDGSPKRYCGGCGGEQDVGCGGSRRAVLIGRLAVRPHGNRVALAVQALMPARAVVPIAVGRPSSCALMAARNASPSVDAEWQEAQMVLSVLKLWLSVMPAAFSVAVGWPRGIRRRCRSPTGVSTD